MRKHFLTPQSEHIRLDYKIAKICIRAQAPLYQVLKTLQDNPFGICLVVDEDSKIIGTVTDGDCRRALLKGNSLELTAQNIMHKEFVVVDETFSLDQIKTLMRTNGVDQIPVVNRKNQVIDLITAKSFYKPQQRDTAALILAGGKGKRLLPLTEAIPKPMLPVGDKPMIENLVSQLVDNGIKNIYISINYLGHIIRDYFGNGDKFGCNIEYITEDIELGTAGPLKALKDRATSPVLVVNGDLVTSVNFAACIDFHHSRKHHLTVAVSNYEHQVPFGVVTTNQDGIITSIHEKPAYSFSVNAGLYAVEPLLLDLIPENTFFPMTDLIDAAMKEGYKVGAFAVHESWADVGLMEQYVAVSACAYSL
jgi:dTDP-glucose pyrophosphorylase/CBS domain-containing protein